MLKQYMNPHPTREPRSNKVVPMSEFKQDIEGYRSELQYSQLQPRNFDPDTILRKSEGELMRTFEAKSLMGASLDQLAMDQLARQQGEENAMRIRQIATDTHLPAGFVEGHVSEQASAPAHRSLVGGLHAHADAHAAQEDADRHAASLADMARQTALVEREPRAYEMPSARSTPP